ncbi:MAG: asparaginase [Mycobacterium leprae]
MSAIVVEQTRGPLVENIYRGDAAVVDANGRLLMHVGDAGKTTFWRSSAKPIQAMPVILSGAATAFGFETRHLAMFCASHNGEPIHTTTVLDAMRLAGVSPDLLQCGPQIPYDAETAAAMATAGEAPAPIHNNCSGKHSGMLAMGKHLGLPLNDYMNPRSDLQRLILANVADVVGLPEAEIAIGIDGCGVPVFGMPIFNMAYAYARLSEPERMPEGKAGAARQLRDAMMAHPYNVAGRNRICTKLMSLPGDRFVAKSGAEGVYCIGLLPKTVAASPVLRAMGVTGGIGIAVKAEDGHKDVRHLMLVEILRQLGVLTDSDLEALAPYRSIPVRNWAGTLVGEMRPAFTLERA